MGIRSRRNPCRNGTGKNITPGQPENERYLNYVADKFDLRRDIRFHAHVTSAVFNEGEDCWQVHLEDGHRARAQFLITAVGSLSAYYIPDFEGLDSFKGTWCHTGRWPGPEGMDLAGKRVGVIGTGATGVQLITEIAKEVGHLTVFQRTANYSCSVCDGSIDPETQRLIKASYPEIFKKCSERRRFVYAPVRPSVGHGRSTRTSGWSSTSGCGPNRVSRNGWLISMTS